MGSGSEPLPRRVFASPGPVRAGTTDAAVPRWRRPADRPGPAAVRDGSAVHATAAWYRRTRPTDLRREPERPIRRAVAHGDARPNAPPATRAADPHRCGQ